MKGHSSDQKKYKKKPKIVDVEIEHATTKHVQTIGILRRNPATIKIALRISTGERKLKWHNYVQIAENNYKTRYQESLRCKPTTVFHGRIPYNAIDLKLRNKPPRQQQHNRKAVNTDMQTRPHRKSKTTATSSTQRQTTNQQNAHSVIVSGPDLA